MLGKKFEWMGVCAFENCRQLDGVLKVLSTSDNFRGMGQRAFNYAQFQRVEIHSTNIIDHQQFVNNTNIPIYVPKDNVDIYKKEYGWYKHPIHALEDLE